MKRQQVRYRLLHYACRLDYLRQKHLARAEQVAHYIHAIHQRTLDHLDRAPTLITDFEPCRFGILHDVSGNASHQRVSQTLLDRLLAP